MVLPLTDREIAIINIAFACGNLESNLNEELLRGNILPGEHERYIHQIFLIQRNLRMGLIEEARAEIEKTLSELNSILSGENNE